jgi:hypothetical protein
MPIAFFPTKVKASNLPQPNSYTCQSACIAMVCNSPGSEIPIIRSQLEQMGDAGNPGNMGKILGQKLGSRYQLDLDSSLKDCQEWLKSGEILITHGWFTRSGHVIVLDGLEADTSNLSYRLSAKDPWGEFDFASFRYLPGINFYDGFYSSRGIYATCVKSVSLDSAISIYRRGELDSNLGGMWVHRIKPV